MVNKVEAVRLRKSGLSYAKIAAQLGCSEVWCKKELVGVVKGDVSAPDGNDVKIQAVRILEDALMKLRAI